MKEKKGRNNKNKKSNITMTDLNEEYKENRKQEIKLMIEEEFKNINWEQIIENAIQNKESKTISTGLNEADKEYLKKEIKLIIDEEFKKITSEQVTANSKRNNKKGEKKDEIEYKGKYDSGYEQEGADMIRSFYPPR